MTRRSVLQALPALAASASLSSASASAQAPAKGRFKQAVTRGCFRRRENPFSFDDMCRISAELGVEGFDLVGPQDFPTLKKYGLTASMVSGGSGIKAGLTDPALHATIEPKMRQAINDAASVGAPNVIVLSGDRVISGDKRISDEEGMENCASLLKKVVGQAEDKGVTLCMELLNSKVNHPGYMCDLSKWGVELCKRVGSPRFRLLYDIYHMQIMEGDIIRTIRENYAYYAHFHTAGNPGRHEFDETQEINYRPIALAIAELGFTGFVAHEYTPLKDRVESLKQSLAVFRV